MIRFNVGVFEVSTAKTKLGKEEINGQITSEMIKYRRNRKKRNLYFQKK